MTFIIGTGSVAAERATEIAEQRQPDAGRGGARDRERHAQQRVRAEIGFVRRAVEFDQRAVEIALRGRVEPLDRGTDQIVDGRDRLEHAFAAVALRVAVAQFDRLVRAGRRARRDERLLDGAERRRDGHGDRRISARIQHLASVNALDERRAAAAHRFDHVERLRARRRAPFAPRVT